MNKHKTYSGPYSEPESKLKPLEYMRRPEECDDLDAEVDRFWDSDPGPKDVGKAIVLRAKLYDMLRRLQNDLP